MVIIVDGYNVIKFLLSYHRNEHEGQRDWLISKLAGYRRAKRDQIKEVIVVFDGGMSRHRQREVHYGVVTVFAGHTYSADDVIAEYAQHFHAGAVIVSNDRELGRRCTLHNAATIKVDAFFELVEQACTAHEEETVDTHRFGSVVITKLADQPSPKGYGGQAGDLDDGGLGEDGLDELMIAGSLAPVHKPSDVPEEPKEFDRGRTLSKKERVREQFKKEIRVNDELSVYTRSS